MRSAFSLAFNAICSRSCPAASFAPGVSNISNKPNDSFCNLLVVPGIGEVSAKSKLINLLNNVDLPELTGPIMIIFWGLLYTPSHSSLILWNTCNREI